MIAATARSCTTARAQDWIGRTLGVLTLTPYDVWRRTHSIHHAHHGDLDQRGIGDVLTLTVEEYRARSGFGRLMYRLYRHPLVLFVLGPSYLFILQNRLPLGADEIGLALLDHGHGDQCDDRHRSA